MRVGPDDTGSGHAMEAAVAALAALDPAPHAVVITGDLADGAFAREYERVLELLAPLEMPVHVLGGNHDDRDALHEYFPAGGRPGEPYRHTALVGGIRLIACDTTIPGRVEGRLEDEQREWIDAQLGDEAAQAVLAMHHPPMTLGMPALDRIGMPEADLAALGALLAARPRVRRLIAGHVHRTAVGVIGGCPVLALASTNLQAKLEIGAAEYTMVAEPATFALHVLVGEEVVSHLQPVIR